MILRRRGARADQADRREAVIPRHNGIDVDGVAQTEVDHFGNCPVCGALIDMRDLGQVLAHVHDAEIEISEGLRTSQTWFDA
jgi:hypothetical protein